MKRFWNWLVKNFSNLFTILGIVLTVYFSIFYVPNYIREYENEKINNINSDLIESIQEIVYNQYHIDQRQIEALIKGKEIKYKIEYPYTSNELLIQTQEAFMSNKFIPLRERVSVVNTIDSLLSTIKENVPDDQRIKSSYTFLKDYNKYEGIVVIFSILIGIITASIGSLSFFIKIKKERKQNIKQQVEQEKDEIENRIINAIHFEKSVRNILKKNKILFTLNEDIKDLGFDFKVQINNLKRVYISVKYISDYRPFSTSEIDKILFPHTEVNIPRIIILNKADVRLIKFINTFSKRLVTKFHLIVSSDINEIEAALLEYLKSLS